MKPIVHVDVDANTLTIILPLIGSVAETISREVDRLNNSPIARQHGIEFTAANVVIAALSGLSDQANLAGQAGPDPVRIDPPAPPIPVVANPVSRTGDGLPTSGRRRQIDDDRKDPDDLDDLDDEDQVYDVLPNGVVHPFASVPTTVTDKKIMLDSTGIPIGQEPRQVEQGVVSEDVRYVHMSVPLDFTAWSGPVPDGLKPAFRYYAKLAKGYPPGFGWRPYRVRMSIEDTRQIGVFVGFWANRLIDQVVDGKPVKPFDGFNKLPLGGAQPGSSKGVAHVLYVEGDFDE